MSDQMTEDRVGQQVSTVLQQIRGEIKKFVEDFSESGAIPDKANQDARAAVIQNITQVVHSTWSQLHQAEFNREMARNAGHGSPLALPRMI